jgi:hypothetical protein
VVRALAKKLKAAGIVRYLEVHMVALKSIYIDKLVAPLQHLATLEATGQSPLSQPVDAAEAGAGAEAEPLEEGDYLRIIRAGCLKVEALATRMAQSLGVTADQFVKQEGDIGREALSSFVNVGLHWALQESPAHALFLDSLAKYTRFLKADQLKAVRASLRLLLEDGSLGLFDLLERYEQYQQGQEGVDMGAAEVLRASAVWGFMAAVGHKSAAQAGSGTAAARASLAPGAGADAVAESKAGRSRSHSTARKSAGSSRDLEALLLLHGERVQSARSKQASKRRSGAGAKRASASLNPSLSEDDDDDDDEQINNAFVRGTRRSARHTDVNDSAIEEGEEEDEEEEEEKGDNKDDADDDDDDLFRSHTLQRGRGAVKRAAPAAPAAPVSVPAKRGTSVGSGSRPALSLALEDMSSTRSSTRSSSAVRSVEEEEEEEVEEEEDEEEDLPKRASAPLPKPTAKGAPASRSASAASGGLPSSRRFRNMG